MTDLEKLIAVFTDIGVKFEHRKPESSNPHWGEFSDVIDLEWNSGAQYFAFDAEGKLQSEGVCH